MTTFEERVYAALKKVPRGSFITYGELARRAGYPRAARAVGNALNKNPFAPAVPCHRVVRSDGSIGGYARGVRAKMALLQREGVKIGNGRVRQPTGVAPTTAGRTLD